MEFEQSSSKLEIYCETINNIMKSRVHKFYFAPVDKFILFTFGK